MALPHAPAGVYDAFGNELTHAHLQAHVQHMLGEPLSQLAAQHHALVQQAQAEAADHPIHEQVASSAENVAAASHDRLSGIWRVDRFNAPIEHYAYRITNNIGYGVTVPESAYADMDFAALPADVRVAADAAMKRDMHPMRTEWEETAENLFLTVGITAMWQQAIGTSISANSGASPAQTYAYYNNAQARIAVGDSSTAASAGQTWLQASTNKYALGMDSTYPTQSTNQAVFRITVTSSNANYA